MELPRDCPVAVRLRVRQTLMIKIL